MALLALMGAGRLARGLDHVPIAVNNLEQAQADFQKLGFTLKAGRSHTNGIRNAHIKFADGTEIELITVSQPTDVLASEYATFIREGDGPAFWSLYAPDLPTLSIRLRQINLAPKNSGDIVTFSQTAFPHRLFFASRQPSPTDRPEFFVHPNTALRLAAIWLAITPHEHRLLGTLGAIEMTGKHCAPFRATATALELPEADIVAVQPDPRQPPARAVIGATVLVSNLRTASALLERNGITPTLPCGNASVWIDPAHAHGLWLELKQP